MRLMSWSESFDPLLRLQEALDRAFQRPLGWEPGLSGGGVFPSINVFADPEGYVIRCEVPGVEHEKLSVEARGQTLTIAGSRPPVVPSQGSFHRRERWSGAFSRSVQLPLELDTGRIEASYRHGILTLRVPRREEAKPRHIDVKAG